MIIQAVLALLFTSFAFSLGAETEDRHMKYRYHEHDFDEDDDDDHDDDDHDHDDEDDDNEEFAPMRELPIPESRQGCYDDFPECTERSCRFSPRKCKKTCGRCEFAPERALEKDLPEAFETDFDVEAERQAYNFEDDDDDDDAGDDDDDFAVNFNDGCNGCEKAPPGF